MTNFCCHQQKDDKNLTKCLNRYFFYMIPTNWKPIKNLLEQFLLMQVTLRVLFLKKILLKLDELTRSHQKVKETLSKSENNITNHPWLSMYTEVCTYWKKKKSRRKSFDNISVLKRFNGWGWSGVVAIKKTKNKKMDNFVLSINGDIPRSTVRMYKNNENVKKKDDFCW